VKLEFVFVPNFE